MNPWFPAAMLATAMLTGCPRFHAGPVPGAPAGSTFATVDGVRLRYIDRGQGPTVVLIHGFSSSLDIWTDVAEKLAAHHRVIALDLKGFGYSGRPEGDYSPPAQADLVWKLLDQRGVDDIAVVGHSWGASVALAMVLERPRKVRRVALYSAYVYEDQVPSFLRWARVGGIGEVLFSLYYRQRLADRVALAYHDTSYVTADRIARVEHEFGRPGATAAALAAARGQRYEDVERRYPTIDQPVLLLWGENDRVTPIAFAQRLVRELPDAHLMEIAGCGHIPMIEAARPTTRALARFLAEDAE